MTAINNNENGKTAEIQKVIETTLEDWSRTDPNFPPIHRFADSRVRKVKESDAEIYERAALVRGRRAG
jgi:hypothetical protein